MLKRRLLRRAAKLILEKELGFRVEIERGQRGVATGARLSATKGSQTITVAVRSSLSRRVKLMRTKEGTWQTIPEMDLVVVAVPANRASTAIEVLGFEPPEFLKAFDGALKTLPKSSDPDFPVVVSLDESSSSGHSLGSMARWRHVLSLDAPELRNVAENQSETGFVERVKREFAEIAGVDVSEVSVEFKIISGRRE